MDRPFYSITINGKNTWDEWQMMPVGEGKIEFSSPKPKTDYVSVPGSSNFLDFSEVLTGYPTYDPREGSLKFRFKQTNKSVRARWQDFKNFVHGQKVTIVNEDEPEYYYEGRMSVGDLEYKSRGDWADVDVNYVLNAYKAEIVASDEDWLWNPFNFESGVIREYTNIIVGGDGESPLTFHIEGSPKRQPLVMTFSRNTLPTSITEVGFFWVGTYEEPETEDFSVTYGKHTYPQIVIPPEGLDVTFSGNYKVTIHYRGGAL